MRGWTTRRSGLVAAGAVAAAALGALTAGVGASPPALTGVPQANDKVPGQPRTTVLSPQLAQLAVAQGSTKLENPTAALKLYGYVADGDPVPAPGATTEAQKTEPDKNTYLVLRSASGARPEVRLRAPLPLPGTRVGDAGLITRINLDGDAAHRVTAFATSYRSSQDGSVKPLPNFDGSTWDPFAHRLLFTAEWRQHRRGLAGAAGLQRRCHEPLRARPLGLDRVGGYEGIQTDSAGDVSLIADQGGAAGALYPNAKQPNSFVYRFVPDASRRPDERQAAGAAGVERRQADHVHAAKLLPDLRSQEHAGRRGRDQGGGRR